MSFTHPAHLWGLLALAIPIIIHLFNFKRFKKVWFTNVKLIRQLSEETRRQSKIRHLIILMLRLLAIAALVMVFAGPFIPNKDAGASTGKRKLISVYLDNSFSMEMRDSENILLETAKNMIPEIVSVYSGEDVFRFITNEMKPEHNHLMSGKELSGYASLTELSPATVPLSVILDRFREVPKEVKELDQEIFIISDMQKSTTDFQQIEKDSTIKVRMLALEAGNHDNIYPDSCWFENPVNLRGRMLTLYCRINNTSDKDLEKVPVRLMIEGKQKALATIDIPAKASANAQFSFIDNTTGLRTAEVSVTDFPVTYDDTYFFTYDIVEEISVLIVNEESENKYLTALFSSDSIFRLKNIPTGQLSPAVVAQHDLIILNEVINPGSGMASELKKQCENGKGVVIIPATDNVGKNILQQTFGLAPLQEYDSSRIRVSTLQLQSGFFSDVFNANELKNGELPEKTDLPFITGHFKTDGTMPEDQPLMTLASGEVFLSQTQSGNGWVYRFTSPLTEEAGNFVHHALFVPTFYRMAFLSMPEARQNITIGKDNHISINTNGIDTEGSRIHSNDDSYMFIPGVSSENGTTGFSFYGNISEAGFYNIRQTINETENHLFTFSANYDRMESDLACYSEDQGKRLLTDLNIKNISIIQTPPDKLSTTLEELEQGRKLWHYFVYLCLLFLLAEVILLRIWK